MTTPYGFLRVENVGKVAPSGGSDPTTRMTGKWVNLLIDGTPVPPSGGAAFHDTAIWLQAEASD